MPKKTSTSSPSSCHPCSEGGENRARLFCPADLPGLTLALAVESAQTQPRHAHDSLVLGLVTAGERRISTAEASVCIAAGQGFAIAPGLAHACAPQRGRCSYLALSLEQRALPTHTQLPRFLRWSHPALATSLLALAEAVAAPAGALERQSLLTEVLEGLEVLARGTPASEAQDRAKVEAGLAQAVEKAREMLTADLEPGLGLSALALACGLDMYVLHRAFTRLTGLPPHAFQTHQRLRRAKESLRAGLSPGQAALEAGFCDQSHLNRHFLRLVGVTPAQYARAHAHRG